MDNKGIKKGNTKIQLQLTTHETSICACCPTKKIIFVGKNLNPEFMENPEKTISDILTHECIHQVLFDMFKNDGEHEAFIISKLFDSISHYFYNEREIFEFFNLINKKINGKIIKSYKNEIKTIGIKNWLTNSGIDTNIVNQAFIIINQRLKNEG